MINPIKNAAERVGGVVALSKALGLSRGAVSNWTKIPVGRVNDVYVLTGLSREFLRPDIFADPSQPKPTEKDVA